MKAANVMVEMQNISADMLVIIQEVADHVSIFRKCDNCKCVVHFV